MVELSNVTKKFGNITAIDHMDLSIRDGEYLCILGQTGAGKTTLLRIIAGLVKPNKGKIYINGKQVNRLQPEERNAVYMFQQFALFPHMNVWENVSFGPTIKEKELQEVKTVTSKVLDMVKLSQRKNAYPNELSGGMQQRTALARGIASGARILLLDEPLGALDARLRVDLRTQLRKLVKEQGLTAVHVTHDQEEALMISDRIVVLRRGKIEQIGTPHDIYSKPKSIFVTNFVGGANFIEGNIVRKDNSISIVETRSGHQFRVLNTKRQIGERVVVAIRLEEILIASKDTPQANNISGKIYTSVFIGDSMEYQIDLGNEFTVFSRMLLSDDSKFFDVGEDVVVFFFPARCRIFPYPKSGLLKEIEAI